MEGVGDPGPELGRIGKRPLKQVWETYLAHHGDGLKRTTRANWEQEWRAHIASALGEWPVGKVTVLAVKDFMAALEKRGVGPATRQKCRSILHRVLQEAVEIAANPAAAPGTHINDEAGEITIQRTSST